MLAPGVTMKEHMNKAVRTRKISNVKNKQYHLISFNINLKEFDKEYFDH
jgi:hypothetical protein